MSFHQNHSSQGHLSNKEPVIDCGLGVHLVVGGQKYSWQSNGGSEINNPWSRERRGIIYLFKAYEGFKIQFSLKRKCLSIPTPQNPEFYILQWLLDFNCSFFTIGNMVLLPEACYNILLLSLYLDLPLDSIAAGQDIMV